MGQFEKDWISPWAEIAECYVFALLRYGNGVMLAMILPGENFKDNLQKLSGIDSVERIDLVDGKGVVVACIENQPGKKGSLAVYQHLAQVFDHLDAKAAEYGLAVFAEHAADARNRPGAHPNVDRLLAIASGGHPLRIKIVAVSL